MSNLTTAPKTWFREEPAYAAELYALERWGLTDQQERSVYVVDDAGVTHRYAVTMRRIADVTVKVEKL